LVFLVLDGEISEALASLENSMPDNTQETVDDTDESSFDFDLPDESHFLETSIR